MNTTTRPTLIDPANVKVLKRQHAGQTGYTVNAGQHGTIGSVAKDEHGWWTARDRHDMIVIGGGGSRRMDSVWNLVVEHNLATNEAADVWEPRVTTGYHSGIVHGTTAPVVGTCVRIKRHWFHVETVEETGTGEYRATVTDIDPTTPGVGTERTYTVVVPEEAVEPQPEADSTPVCPVVPPIDITAGDRSVNRWPSWVAVTDAVMDTADEVHFTVEYDEPGWERETLYFSPTEEIQIERGERDERGVVLLDPDDPRASVCGHCGQAWDDSISTSVTPTPSGRCPFEHEHEYDDDDEPMVLPAVDSVGHDPESGTLFVSVPQPDGTAVVATIDPVFVPMLAAMVEPQQPQTSSYSVSVECTFDNVESPEDAVRMMVAWLADSAPVAGYRVQSEDGTSVFLDAEDIDLDD